MILLSVSSDPALILFRKAADPGKTKQQLKSLLAEKKKGAPTFTGAQDPS